MGGKIRYTYTPGQKIGSLTYLCDSVNRKTGHRMVKVQCDCGRVYDAYPQVLKNANAMCFACSNKIKAQSRVRHDIVGQKIGLWKVLEESSLMRRGGHLYKCECQRCHNISYRTSNEILRTKGTRRCSNCKPDFNFKVVDDYAIGTLPSGHTFIIDAEDIEKVSQYNWYKKADQNYIIADRVDGKRVRLHRFVLGMPPIDMSENDYVVDHINRDPMDCRKSNLRVATQHQNCFNKAIRSCNTTGYIGVSASASGQYTAKICFNDKTYTLGYDKDPAKCAAMYNYASRLLFASFIGHQNEVPELTPEEKNRVFGICKPLMCLAEEVTKPVAFFSTPRKGDIYV